MITIAALASVLAVALVAASSVHASDLACTLTGSTLTGTTGNDVMCGTGFADNMNGNSGDDELRGGEGNDFLSGGEGSDSLLGGFHNDTVIGGPGFDLLSGDFSGDPSGNDRLLARDGNLDSVRHFLCGTGTDSLDMDLLDAAALAATVVPGKKGLSAVFDQCEIITVGAVNEGPNVKISRRSVDVGEDGRVAVRLRCPASLATPCEGKLRIGRTPKTEGKRTQYSIDQGKKEDVSARLSQRDRNKLSQRGRITALVTSVEQGQHGDKTTVQTIKLIAQG